MAVTVVGWHTLESARAEWVEAPYQDAILQSLLTVAEEQCEAYAPADAFVGARYRQAQLMQARALWLSTESNASDQIGAEGFTVTVYPMDRVIKNILRPKRGVPIVG